MQTGNANPPLQEKTDVYTWDGVSGLRNPGRGEGSGEQGEVAGGGAVSDGFFTQTTETSSLLPLLGPHRESGVYSSRRRLAESSLGI